MEWLIALENARQNFLAGLDQSFGPARLLRFERGHLNWQFCGTLNVLQINKFPAFELRTVRKIGIFGEGIVLPSTSLFNRLFPPDTGRSIEIKKNIAAGASRVLEHEMSIEQDGFDFGKKRIMAINVCPARLYHADFQIGEMVNCAQQEIFRRNKVRIEDRDELALCRFHPLT